MIRRRHGVVTEPSRRYNAPSRCRHGAAAHVGPEVETRASRAAGVAESESPPQGPTISAHRCKY
eukprot:355039-Chlamydomonas_euryale.AAC.3